MLAPGLYSPDLVASWHMLVPPLLEICMSSTPCRVAREQFSAWANEFKMEGDTCKKTAGRIQERVSSVEPSGRQEAWLHPIISSVVDANKESWQQEGHYYMKQIPSAPTNTYLRNQICACSIASFDAPMQKVQHGDRETPQQHVGQARRWQLCGE